MGHLDQFEAELRTRIEAVEPGAEADQLIQWLKEQVLESYKNGRAAGARAAKDGERVPRRDEKK